MLIRKAQIKDISEIHRLLNAFSNKGPILPQAKSDIYKYLRDYWLFCDDREGQILGVCALHIFWEDAAEIRSLAVRERVRGQSIAEELVKSCIKDAKALGVCNVYILTSIPDYFENFGFTEIDKKDMPPQIWADCIKCHKFPNCDEIAMALDIKKLDL